MNHRTYDSQRYSPLDQINKANVKSLKLAYAVAIGGTSANENLEATPLAEDGFPNVDPPSGNRQSVHQSWQLPRSRAAPQI
jgi:alcohol dehydrogenase (cytochrome c)